MPEFYLVWQKFYFYVFQIWVFGKVLEKILFGKGERMGPLAV
jgi:hypothetical protein